MNTLARLATFGLLLSLLTLNACGGSSSEHAPDVVDAGTTDALPGLDALDVATPPDVFEPDLAGREAAETTGDDTTQTCTGIEETLAEAKEMLEIGQSYMALQLYREAEEQCPDSVEARFGVALAGMVDGIELGLSLLSVANQAFIDDLPELQSQDDWAAEVVHDAMAYLAQRFRDSLARLDGLVDDDVRLSFGQVPVYNTNRMMLEYRGEFDNGDVHLMRAMAQGLLLVLDVLVTQDFRIDIMTLIPIVRGYDGETAEMVLMVMARVLAAGPQALGVHPVDGVEAYDEAGRMIAAFDGSLTAALEWLRNEEPGDTEQVSYLLENSTEALASLVIQAKVTYGDDHLEPPTRGDLLFKIPDDLEAALFAMAESVEGRGDPVPWEDGPVWLLAVMANIIFQTGILGELDLGGLTLPLDRMDIQALADTVKNLVPLPFAFDFGTMFATPTGLRAFLPGPTEDGESVLMDWECPSETEDDGFPDGSGGLLCDSADALEDGPHFVGTDIEFEADGVLSGLPYLGFLDPTWNGLLLADEARIGLSEEEGFVPATQRSLNAGLAVGLEPILNLLIR